MIYYRPTQLYLKRRGGGREGRGGANKLRNTFQSLRSEEFSSRDFGLRSFRLYFSEVFRSFPKFPEVVFRSFPKFPEVVS